MRKCVEEIEVINSRILNFISSIHNYIQNKRKRRFHQGRVNNTHGVRTKNLIFIYATTWARIIYLQRRDIATTDCFHWMINPIYR